MAALRTRISTLLVIFVVAVLAAIVGYQLGQTGNRGYNYRGSSSIDLLQRKKADPPSSCYKFPGNSAPHAQHDNKNPNCP